MLAQIRRPLKRILRGMFPRETVVSLYLGNNNKSKSLATVSLCPQRGSFCGGPSEEIQNTRRVSAQQSSHSLLPEGAD